MRISGKSWMRRSPAKNRTDNRLSTEMEGRAARSTRRLGRQPGPPRRGGYRGGSRRRCQPTQETGSPFLGCLPESSHERCIHLPQALAHGLGRGVERRSWGKFDSVQLMRRLRDHMSEEMAQMSPRERILYIQRKAAASPLSVLFSHKTRPEEVRQEEVPADSSGLVRQHT